MIDTYERAFDEYWSKQWQMSDNDPATNRARFVIAHGAFEAGLDLFWKENDRLLGVIESLQLPQPVAPVQGGGVEANVLWQGESHKLKPCPFCGNAKDGWLTVVGANVYCHECGCTGRAGKDPVDSWNDRSPLTTTKSAPEADHE